MKHLINGVETDVVPVKIVNSQEPFSSYLLEDGSVLRMKSVALHVFRVVGQTDVNGRPAYTIQSQMFVTCEPT